MKVVAEIATTYRRDEIEEERRKPVTFLPYAIPGRLRTELSWDRDIARDVKSVVGMDRWDPSWIGKEGGKGKGGGKGGVKVPGIGNKLKWQGEVEGVPKYDPNAGIESRLQQKEVDGGVIIATTANNGFRCITRVGETIIKTTPRADYPICVEDRDEIAEKLPEGLEIVKALIEHQRKKDVAKPNGRRVTKGVRNAHRSPPRRRSPPLRRRSPPRRMYADRRPSPRRRDEYARY